MMKSTKTFPIFSIALIALSAVFLPAAAAISTPQPAEYPDSTFTLSLNQADRITVRTANINLTIRRWADPKAQLVVSAAPDDWQGDLMVSMRPGSDGIVVELGLKPVNHRHNFQLSSTWSSIKATLDIPDGHEFVLGSSFANVEILSDFKMGNITVNNGELTASGITRLELKTQFSKVHLNTCHQASITANNTTMTIGTVDILQLGSTFSNIDLTTVDRLTFTSNNDVFSIADLGEATGQKTFGSFRIGKLRKGFSFFGQNADISIREISSTIDTLKIEDQFAHLYIPVESIPAFSLHFEGRFATVRSSLPRKPEGNETEMNHLEFTMSKGTGGDRTPSVNLHCNNCEVDLE